MDTYFKMPYSAPVDGSREDWRFCWRALRNGNQDIEMPTQPAPTDRKREYLHYQQHRLRYEQALVGVSEDSDVISLFTNGSPACVRRPR